MENKIKLEKHRKRDNKRKGERRIEEEDTKKCGK